MNTLVKVLLMLARLLFVIQLVLGVCIWFGVGGSLASVHIMVGPLFVLDAWLIALIALFALPRRALPLLTLALGGAIVWFGIAQQGMLVGSMHWAVRLVHLLLGVSMMGLLEAQAKAVITRR